MLKTRSVSFVMTADSILTVDAGDSLERVKQIMHGHPIHHVPVLERGKLVGIISTSDLLRHASLGARVLDEEVKAKDVMETSLVTLRPRDPLLKAARLLTQEQFSSLPVVDDEGELIGILTIRDLVRYIIQHEDVSEN
jgi:acetoin utilization protein AcuB